MTLEMDVEIARLDGCDMQSPDAGPWCDCDDLRHGGSGGIYMYSESLDNLLELIRRRWLDEYFLVSIGTERVTLWLGAHPYEGTDGETDAERLAECVLNALREES